MNGVLVDSCVLLDLFTDDINWASWSEKILEQYSQTNTLYINSIVYTEISIGFNKIEEMESAIMEQRFHHYLIFLLVHMHPYQVLI